MQSKKIVAYINTTGSFLGGAEFCLFELVTNLDKDRYRPIVVVPNWGDFAEKLVQNDVKVINLSGNGFPALSWHIRDHKIYNCYAFFQYIYELLKLKNKLIKFLKHNDIAILHGNSFAGTLFGAMAARKLQIPFIAHLRELPRQGLLSGPIFKSIVRNVAIRRSAACIAISGMVSRAYAFEKRFKLPSIVTMHDPLDIKLFTSTKLDMSFRNVYGLPESAFLIGLVGRFEDWKGHLTALDALDIVIRRSKRQVILVFVGDSKGAQKLYIDQIMQRILDLGLSGNVVMLGLQRDMPNIYSIMDIVIVPSVAEPLGRVVLEAMVMQKLVVATNIGGPAEIITDGIDGFLVSPKDHKALSTRIINLIENPQIVREMGVAARKKIMKQHSIPSYVLKIMELYDHVLIRTKNNRTHRVRS